MVTTPDATVWGPPLMYHVGDQGDRKLSRDVPRRSVPTRPLQKCRLGRLRTSSVNCSMAPMHHDSVPYKTLIFGDKPCPGPPVHFSGRPPFSRGRTLISSIAAGIP